METLSKLDLIHRKIQTLLEENRKLKEGEAKWLNERKLLKKQIEELKEKVLILENKNVNLQTSRFVENDHLDKKEMKAHIDFYIKQIDQLIEILKA